MNDELMKEIKRLACKELAGDGVERTNHWNGYEVWKPIYNEPVFISYCPFVILVKDGKARISTHEESFAYLWWKHEQKKNANGENR